MDFFCQKKDCFHFTIDPNTTIIHFRIAHLDESDQDADGHDCGDDAGHDVNPDIDSGSAEATVVPPHEEGKVGQVVAGARGVGLVSRKESASGVGPGVSLQVPENAHWTGYVLLSVIA